MGLLAGYQSVLSDGSVTDPVTECYFEYVKK